MYGRFFSSLLIACFSVWALPVFAAEPLDWQIGLQPPASPSAEKINNFHNLLLWIITGISVFVLMLLLFVIARYNKRANPEPSKTTHNVMIEIVWTLVPVIILLIIVIPSFKVLYYIDRTGEPEMTLKVTGYQWYWGYEYPDHGDINFLSYMIPDDEIDPAKGQKRLLSTDVPVVLPVDTNIQILITAADVLHAWAVPAFGLKTDAIPGRLNETWVRIEKPGVYYGQCSELCGKDHSYMPVEIHAVSKEKFAVWVIKNGGTMPDTGQPEASTEEIEGESL